MQIDKIKNYNQRLLAILGTLACLLLIMLIVMVVIEMLPRRSYQEIPQGLISDEQVEILNQENLRKQIISYESPWLIDTLQSIYIVPVSIKTLKRPEEVVHEPEYGVLGLMDSSAGWKKGRGYYSSKNFYGKYANLIIYQPGEGKAKSLFNERLIIGEVNTYYFKDDILLIFYIASKDTDKNGVIDLEDLRSLCIYSMKTDVMKRVAEENQVEEYKFVENSKDLLIRFTLNQYTSNQFDNNELPGKIMKYEYGTQKLVDIIPAQIQTEMQKWVEGK